VRGESKFEALKDKAEFRLCCGYTPIDPGFSEPNLMSLQKIICPVFGPDRDKPKNVHKSRLPLETGRAQLPATEFAVLNSVRLMPRSAGHLDRRPSGLSFLWNIFDAGSARSSEATAWAAGCAGWKRIDRCGLTPGWRWLRTGPINNWVVFLECTVDHLALSRAFGDANLDLDRLGLLPSL